MLRNISSLVNVRWHLGIPFNDTSNFRLAIADQGQKILGDYLIGLQAGNEPDLYADHGHRPSVSVVRSTRILLDFDSHNRVTLRTTISASLASSCKLWEVTSTSLTATSSSVLTSTLAIGLPKWFGTQASLMHIRTILRIWLLNSMFFLFYLLHPNLKFDFLTAAIQATTASLNLV